MEGETHRKPKRFAVRVVEPRGPSLVVEVHDKADWYRAVIPISTVDERSTVAEPDLQAGRYGEDWAALIKTEDFPQRCAEALHIRGIFSFAELRAKGPEAKGAILEAAQVSLLALLSKEK